MPELIKPLETLAQIGVQIYYTPRSSYLFSPPNPQIQVAIAQVPPNGLYQIGPSEDGILDYFFPPSGKNHNTKSPQLNNRKGYAQFELFVGEEHKGTFRLYKSLRFSQKRDILEANIPVVLVPLSSYTKRVKELVAPMQRQLMLKFDGFPSYST